MQKHVHIVAAWGGNLIPENEVAEKYAEFVAAVQFFNTTHNAVPHPGYFTFHKFCPECAAKLKSKEEYLQNK